MSIDARRKNPARLNRRLGDAMTECQHELRVLGQSDFGGYASSVGEARAWARELLSGHVAEEVLNDAVLLLSELITNSVIHSDSGREPGGLVTVILAARDGVVHCEVVDDGSATSVPHVQKATQESAGGRGLWLVRAMADAYGVCHDDEAGNAVWFQVGGCTATAPVVSFSPYSKGGTQQWCS